MSKNENDSAADIPDSIIVEILKENGLNGDPSNEEHKQSPILS